MSGRPSAAEPMVRLAERALVALWGMAPTSPSADEELEAVARATGLPPHTRGSDVSVDYYEYSCFGVSARELAAEAVRLLRGGQ